MPSTMIHLAISKKYNKTASASFFLGSIAPDATYDREEKDRRHFRNKKDRWEALCVFAKELNVEYEYNRGYLLHLYTDYQWDTSALIEFITTIEEGHWFKPYRREIMLAGSWLYHHSVWSKDLLSDMLLCKVSDYDNGYEVDVENMRAYVDICIAGYKDNDIGPSEFYTPEYINTFTDKITCEFDEWTAKIKSL